MGAILAVVAHKLNTTTSQEHQGSVSAIMGDKPKPKEELCEEVRRKDCDNYREVKKMKSSERLRNLRIVHLVT